MVYPYEACSIHPWFTGDPRAEPRCFTKVQKIYLTFMADLLGDVAGSLGPPCETATAASVLSSFQEGHFLSSVSAKDPAEKKG